MKRELMVTIVAGGLALAGQQVLGQEANTNRSAHPMVTIKTALDNIKLELREDKAPETVKNFLQYVDDKHYNGTIFHRVIENFMIQGGGFTPDMTEKAARPPIKNEAGNGLKNERGTVAMARRPDPDSASAQFFINVKDNPPLDFQAPTPAGYGYCVFGRVVEGLDVVDKIKTVKTGTRGPFRDVPVDPVLIQEISRAPAAGAKQP